VSFPWCFIRSTSVIQYSQRPVAGYNVCLRVGGLDVKIDFVPKFDIIGLVEVSFLVGREPFFLKIIKVCVWCRLK